MPLHSSSLFPNSPPPGSPLPGKRYMLLHPLYICTITFPLLFMFLWLCCPWVLATFQVITSFNPDNNHLRVIVVRPREGKRSITGCTACSPQSQNNRAPVFFLLLYNQHNKQNGVQRPWNLSPKCKSLLYPWLPMDFGLHTSSLSLSFLTCKMGINKKPHLTGI